MVAMHYIPNCDATNNTPHTVTVCQVKQLARLTFGQSCYIQIATVMTYMFPIFYSY